MPKVNYLIYFTWRIKMNNTINFEEIRLSDEERQPCEVWTRVMGYFRPVSEFNVGKKSEFYSRKCFCESKAVIDLEKYEIAAE